MTPAEVMAPLEALAGERDNKNNTSVNQYYKWPGAAYCGLSVRYAFEKSGNGDALAACANTAYVPTFLAFCRKNWAQVAITKTAPGDVFIYDDDHTGFIYMPVSGSTVITLEGNAQIWPNASEALASHAGSGKYEGIGYKKRVLNNSYTIWRPPYTDGDQQNYGPTAYTGTFHLLKVGNYGPEVKIVQRILYSRYGTLRVTGRFDQETADYVRRAQIATGCMVDGEVGNETWPALLFKL